MGFSSVMRLLLVVMLIWLEVDTVKTNQGEPYRFIVHTPPAKVRSTLLAPVIEQDNQRQN